MNTLLLRPHPGNDRFGLGPFLWIEIPYIIRVLLRTQRMMKPAEYLWELRESRCRVPHIPCEGVK
ncbi:MAG: hypothetical protein ABSA86_06715 [Oryzomonas sp.]|jgi:hypothetical protein